VALSANLQHFHLGLPAAVLLEVSTQGASKPHNPGWAPQSTDSESTSLRDSSWRNLEGTRARGLHLLNPWIQFTQLTDLRHVRVGRANAKQPCGHPVPFVPGRNSIRSAHCTPQRASCAPRHDLVEEVEQCWVRHGGEAERVKVKGTQAEEELHRVRHAFCFCELAPVQKAAHKCGVGAIQAACCRPHHPPSRVQYLDSQCHTGLREVSHVQHSKESVRMQGKAARCPQVHVQVAGQCHGHCMLHQLGPVGKSRRVRARRVNQHQNILDVGPLWRGNPLVGVESAVQRRGVDRRRENLRDAALERIHLRGIAAADSNGVPQHAHKHQHLVLLQRQISVHTGHPFLQLLPLSKQTQVARRNVLHTLLHQ